MGYWKNKLIENEILYEEIKDNKGVYHAPNGCHYWATINPVTGDVIILEYEYDNETNVDCVEIHGVLPEWYLKAQE